MPVSITIRHVPDTTRDALAERAARSGRSMQEYLAAELQRLATEPTVDDWLADARRSAQGNPPLSVDDLVGEIEADRR